MTIATDRPEDTRLILDKFVALLEEIYEVLDDRYETDSKNGYVLGLIEDALEEYKSKYGKDARRSTR